MTNFTSQKLFKLFGKFSDQIKTNWNTGRRRKSSHTSKDVLFMMLCVLNHGRRWDISAKLLQIKITAFERLIVSYLVMFLKWVFEELVLSLSKSFSMSDLMSDMKLILFFSVCAIRFGCDFSAVSITNGSRSGK